MGNTSSYYKCPVCRSKIAEYRYNAHVESCGVRGSSKRRRGSRNSRRRMQFNYNDDDDDDDD